jgi:hypothetical protein
MAPYFPAKDPITGIYKFSLLCQVMKYYWLFTILMLTVRDCSVSLTKIKPNLDPGSVTQHLVIYFVQNIHSLSWYQVFLNAV